MECGIADALLQQNNALHYILREIILVYNCSKLSWQF